MVRKHSISIRGHRTSFSLEEEFWQELQGLASNLGLPTAKLITRIDETRDPDQNLSSALRVYVLKEVLKTKPNPIEASK